MHNYAIITKITTHKPPRISSLIAGSTDAHAYDKSKSTWDNHKLVAQKIMNNILPYKTDITIHSGAISQDLDNPLEVAHVCTINLEAQPTEIQLELTADHGEQQELITNLEASEQNV